MNHTPRIAEIQQAERRRVGRPLSCTHDEFLALCGSRTCEACGDEYWNEKEQSQREWNMRRYCSRECASTEGRRKMARLRRAYSVQNAPELANELFLAGIRALLGRIAKERGLADWAEAAVLIERGL